MTSLEDAALVSVKAGVNLELHAGQFATGVYDWLKDAVDDGLVSEVRKKIFNLLCIQKIFKTASIM